ncbi:MAG: GTP 3',8-cyclase MoaA [Lachnospiraceae bacterium]|nr:GTP 3',8-cyclase MoaA [Lachnospiraceae bacterium]
MKDQYGRIIDYMRISVTDRCNLRCRYCMPDGVEQLSMNQILTYEEIAEIVRAAAESGIDTFKITGGEPLVRKGCASLIGMLKQIPGVRQVTLTTNGVLLAEKLPGLMQNGLDAVNISLDTTDARKFREITGFDALRDVIEGIDAAAAAGIPVKINVVPQRAVNEEEWEKLVLFAKDRPIDVRFIEMMPIGLGKTACSVSEAEVRAQLTAVYGELKPAEEKRGNGPARYAEIPGFAGRIGFISAIHGKFCDSCNRIRLTSQGKLKPCLCYGDTVDLMEVLRGGFDPEVKAGMLRLKLEEAVRMKPQSHCFEDPSVVTEDKHMSQIGG